MDISVFEMDQREKLDDYTALIGVGLRFQFQPTHDLTATRIFGHEALVRGHDGESARQVIRGVRPENLPFFDQACRNRAIAEAARQGLRSRLFLNCTHITPGNLELALISTSDQLRARGLSRDLIVLEISDLNTLGNARQLAHARKRAHACGFRVCADRFGSGVAGLKQLAVFRPDYLKLDQDLIRNIGDRPLGQAVVLGICETARALGIEVIANGVESEAEVDWLQARAGVRCFQGFLFGRPGPTLDIEIDSGLEAKAAMAS
jgi:EAL domain-containing protein (putative c-di-GMP-specific phosphodiesterase class I)